MQKMVICWLLQATFTRVLSCLFRINHEDWVFSSESFEKYCEPNCGFIPRHDCSTGQEWMRKQGKGNTQTLTNRSRDVQNAKWTGAQKKSNFWRIWHAQSFWEKAITVHLWMRRWEWGRCGKMESETQKEFSKKSQRTTLLPAGDLLYENSVWWFRLIWFCWSD